MEVVGQRRSHLLWVVRHGESTWNAIGRMQREVAHPPLSARGTTQAYAAGHTLRGRHIDRIVSSDAVRARQTAHAMATVLGVETAVDGSGHARRHRVRDPRHPAGSRFDDPALAHRLEHSERSRRRREPSATNRSDYLA
jgi:broad specificity phosphatase PhoE